MWSGMVPWLTLNASLQKLASHISFSFLCNNFNELALFLWLVVLLGFFNVYLLGNRQNLNHVQRNKVKKKWWKDSTALKEFTFCVMKHSVPLAFHFPDDLVMEGFLTFPVFLFECFVWCLYGPVEIFLSPEQFDSWNHLVKKAVSSRCLLGVTFIFCWLDTKCTGSWYSLLRMKWYRAMVVTITRPTLTLLRLTPWESLEILR